jgi:hypothetical protein
MDPADNILPGSLWHKQLVRGELPPLVPALPLDDADWDANLIIHDFKIKGDVNVERRHSGWGAVEKKWLRSQSESANTANK